MMSLQSTATFVLLLGNAGRSVSCSLLLLVDENSLALCKKDPSLDV